MTTLVTGGNGWVPSHIVRRLARRGERVISFDLSAPDDILLRFLGDHAARVAFEQGDITDLPALKAAAERHGVIRLIHAAVITPRVEWERRDPKRIIEVNLIGTVNALEVARSLPDFERMVYVSSCAVWGRIEGVLELTEDLPSKATGLYGITKHTSERFCQRYAELFGIDIVSLRPANVYGPMERITPGYVGATELREIARLYFAGETVRVNSLDGPYLDWTFVEDIAEGIERAWATPRLPHDLYSLTCGRLYSIGDVLAAFQAELPDFTFDVVDRSEANFVVSGETAGPVPSNARMKADFGWAPATPFAEGMHDYIAWMQENGPQ